MGKLFLSSLPPQKRAHMLRAVRLDRYTEHTITDVAAFEEELAKIRTAGVATDNQEFLAGVVCVAVPVRSTGGRIAAALAVSALLARMSLKPALACVPLLRAAAAERLAQTIGDPKAGDKIRSRKAAC